MLQLQLKTACVLIILAAIVILCHGNQAKQSKNRNGPVVNTPLGPILGSTLTSRLGRTIYAFRGIRYGKPPVGELRFKPPRPVEPWQQIYDATADAPMCPQPGNDPIAEDCLFLNIYSPQLPKARNHTKLPVIILLHAGGFYSVTGRSNWAGPQYLLDQDVILVTMNYRLGTLGFLSIGKESPGNNGLRDQVLAMKWVQNNIRPFGGDPNSVTLYGYSAGSWSINLHLISPMSKGLFHKAIMGSGSLLGIWNLPHTQVDLAKRQAQFVGCNTTNSHQIYECLKTVPAEELGRSLYQFSQFANNPILIWSPVIENDYGQERFLAEQPIKLIENGQFMNIPILTGFTKEEFSYQALRIMQNSTLLDQLSNNFDKYAPICFLYESNTAKSKEVSAKARKFYLGEGPLTNNSLQGLKELFYDTIVTFSGTRTARLLADRSSANVYFYQFDYQGRYSHVYLPGSNNTVPYGAVHHDDLIYLFYVSIVFPYFGQNDPESLMVDKLSTLWVNFAKTGNPTPEVTQKLDNLKWEPYNTETDKILHIDNKLHFKQRTNLERYKFWDNLFPVSDYL